ncbi:DUF4781 domain-containing protein [Allohahella sp. A8]|uniref:DUF4781 domain-containing protein n=1 Tax=Allohahella sp. A8 TaxID=3141461 RepID=UPI003A7FDA4E
MNTAIAQTSASAPLNSPAPKNTNGPAVDDFITRYSSTFGPLDTKGMARELADRARQDPVGAKALHEGVIERLSQPGLSYHTEDYYRHVEQELGQRLTPQEVEAFQLPDSLEILTSSQLGDTAVGGNKLASIDSNKLPALAEEIAAGSADSIKASLDKILELPPSDNRNALLSMIFVKTPAEHVELHSGLQASMAQALAETGSDSAEAIAKNTALYTEALASGAGRALLSNNDVNSASRLWAARELANNPDFAKAALSAEGDKPWENKQVLEAHATLAFQPLAQRGDHSVGVAASSSDIENLIGAGLGRELQWPTQSDMPRTDDELAAVTKKALAGELNLYKGDPVVTTISEGIRKAQAQMGGGEIGVATLPIQFSSEETGPVALQLYRVDGEQGQQKFVDNQGRVYDNFENWRKDNKLPPGKMTFPADGGMDNGQFKLVTENTPGVSDTFWEHAGDVARGAALVGGVVATGVILASSAGMATPFVSAAWGVALSSAAFQGGEQIATLVDRSEHGQTLSLSDPDARAAWLDLAASGLTLGGAGAIRTATVLAKTGSQAAPTMARGAGGLNAAATITDAASVGNQGYELSKNWDNLSPGERLQDGLSMAFWGSMIGVSAKASGGKVTDAFSFRAQMNSALLETGAGSRMNPDMGSAVRINQLDAKNGNLSIEHGPDATSDSIEVHTEIARMIIDNGGLQGAVRRAFGSEISFKPGTHGEVVALEALKHEKLIEVTQARMDKAPPQQKEMWGNTIEGLKVKLEGYRSELEAIQSNPKLGDQPAQNGIMVADDQVSVTGVASRRPSILSNFENPVPVTLDSRGKFNGAKNAGTNTPIFEGWIERGGTVHYDADSDTFIYGMTVEKSRGGTEFVEVPYVPSTNPQLAGLRFPDFSRYSVERVEIAEMRGVGETDITPPEIGDFSKAWEALERQGVNVTEVYGVSRRAWGDRVGTYPDTGVTGLTWHHTEDLKTLFFVDSSIHDIFKHKGGASISRMLND